MLGARLVAGIDAARDLRGAVVVEVVVEGAIASAEALLLEEIRVVKKRQRVEDVKVGLSMLAYCTIPIAGNSHLLCQDQGVLDQAV